MQRPTRRTVLVSSGTTALAALAGVGYLAAAPARAVEIDVQELHVADQSWSGPDAPEELPMRVSGEYTIEANVQPDELRLKPTVAVDSGGMGPHEYPTVAQTLDGQTASGEFAFTVDLLALFALREGFPDTAGESTEYNLTLTLGADVTGPQGNKIGSAEVSDGFTLTLTHEQAQASIGLSATAELIDHT